MHEEGQKQRNAVNAAIIVVAAVLVVGALTGAAYLLLHSASSAEPAADVPFEVTLRARLAAEEGKGPAKWQEKSIAVKPGDTVELLLSYTNLQESTHSGVCAGFILPERLSLVPGSAVLYCANYPEGTEVPDAVAEYGANLGAYSGYSADSKDHRGANAKLIVQCKVTESSTAELEPASAWVRAGISGEEATILFADYNFRLK